MGGRSAHPGPKSGMIAAPRRSHQSQLFLSRSEKEIQFHVYNTESAGISRLIQHFLGEDLGPRRQPCAVGAAVACLEHFSMNVL